MRVLLVSHRFPPAHRAGTEQYVEGLARWLIGAGHEVTVLAAEKDIGRADLSLGERAHAAVPGLRVLELVNNLFHADFAQTFAHPSIERLFAGVLERERPEVVHFHHLTYLSLRLPELAKQRGAAVLFTLHDFGLECARFGQLLHADGSLCPTVDPQRCGACLCSFPFAQGALERQAGRAVAALRRGLGFDLSRAARAARVKLARGRRAEAAGQVDPARAQALASGVQRRAQAVREQVLPNVDLFLVPSELLRRRTLALGVPPERVLRIPTGAPAGARWPETGVPTPDPSLLFLGTFSHHKGPHVLLEAWSRTPPALRERCGLELHGPVGGDGEYVRRLRLRAAELGVRLGEPLDAAGVAAAMRRAWLLVVPSLWYENSPLVLQEARRARLPVLASDLGALPEVLDQGAGWLFPAGDAAALAERLAAFMADPAGLERARERVPPPLEFDATAGRTAECYSRVLRSLDLRPGPRTS
jgi:glycosyltransferase involved in cell wall biosynthesis